MIQQRSCKIIRYDRAVFSLAYISKTGRYIEYAVPVCAAANAKDLDKVEQTQVQRLRRLIGAKAHTS